MESLPFVRSVDVHGVLSPSTGWGTHSLGFSRALAGLTTVNFRCRGLGVVRGMFGRDAPMVWRGLLKPPGEFSVIVFGDAPDPDRAARWIVWETTELPDWQRRFCDSVRHLWTPSHWGRSNLIANGIEPGRVSVVPEGVDTDFYRPDGRRRPGPFRFLMVGKWEARKNCEGLLQAFAEEFAGTEPVELVLHAHNPYRAGFSLQDAVAAAGFAGLPKLVLSSPCGPVKLRALYQSADCFVMPTRAEGWGLPILEAMACGVPAIVTRYSAPLDYVNEGNGYLVDVARLIDARDEMFGVDTGQWADPDIAHLRKRMREAYSDADSLRSRAAAARLTAERFNWHGSARCALRTIARTLHGPAADGALADAAARARDEPDRPNP